MGLFLAVIASYAAGIPLDGSMEAFLRRARERREAAQALLVSPVERLVAALEAPELGERPKDLDALRVELDALGPEAAALLLPFLDPGEPAKPESLRRAAEVTAALVRAKPAGLLEELLALAHTGPPIARANAVEVLAALPDAARALEPLIALARGAEPEVRRAALSALSRQESPRALDALREALADDEPLVVSTALQLLASVRRSDVAPAVLELAQNPAQAAPYADEILAYFRSCESAVDEGVLAALLGLARSDAVKDDTRVLVLESFPNFELARAGKLKKDLEPFFRYSNAGVREAALVAASLLGDRAARRELLDPYEQVVADDPSWPEGYERRAAVLFRIQDYAGATRDLRRAIELLSSRAHQGVYRKLWIDLARAYIKSGKVSKASETLEELGLSEALKSEIASDPDFAPLLENPRFRRKLE